MALSELGQVKVDAALLVVILLVSPSEFFLGILGDATKVLDILLRFAFNSALVDYRH